MEIDWAASGYRDIVNKALGYRNLRRPRGAITKLASKLKCHPTFIAQVLKERGDFSPEQGLEICQHYSFNPEQQDLFLTILQRDRAGTASLREHYQNRLNQLLEIKRNLKPTEEDQDTSPRGGAFEAEYFGNWQYQAIHASTQIKRLQSPQAISKALNIRLVDVKTILLQLEAMKLVKNEKSLWISTLNSLHLSKDSHFIRPLHSTWKTKILADLQNKSGLEGTRYSGLVVASEKDYQNIRDILVKAMAEIRKTVDNSPSENTYVLSIDCYDL